jgi:hypothetical protein
VSSYLDRRDEARREFRRICLSSLAATAEAELRERHRTKHLLRSRRPERRLEERRRLLAELDAPTPVGSGAVERLSPWLSSAVASLLVVSVATLAANVGVNGVGTRATGFADGAMLVLALLWFFLPLRQPAPADQP